jgi:hypothetical protein
MVETAAFDPVTFASILMKEVDALANARYGNTSLKSRSKAFVTWCVKNINPELSEQEVVQATAICEPSSPFEKAVEAAWIHSGILYFVQTSFLPIRVPTDPDDQLNLDLFPEDAILAISEEFNRVVQAHQGNAANQTPKLASLVNLYNQALANSCHVRLIVAIDGIPNTDLLRARDNKNTEFRHDHISYRRHFCAVYDFVTLNQIVSQNLGGVPGPEPLQFEARQLFEVPNGSGGIDAVAATISAEEVVRIREKFGYKIYHSNFRYLLKKQGVARPKIQHTLNTPTERSNFWKYNNGITATCSAISFQDNWRYLVDGFQVVNGLQTIEALYDNKDINDNITGVKLLIRLIPTVQVGSAGVERTRILERKIAEYSNSQTQITARDLRSNDEVQRAIERISMEVYGLKYVRKIGEEGETKWPSKYRVDNYEAAQAALSFWRGMSNEASTKARLLFEEAKGPKRGYYEKIFRNSTTAEYVLFPYLLWVSQDSLIKKAPPRVKGSYKSLDLFAISVMGDLLVKKWGLPRSPSRAREQERYLRCGIGDINGLIVDKHMRKLRRLWRPVFEVLNEEVERRRKVESKAKNKPLSQVTPRNIAVKMHYPKDLRGIVLADRRIKTLQAQLGSYFSC